MSKKYPMLEMINDQQYNEPGTKEQIASQEIIKDLRERYFKIDEDFEVQAYQKLNISGISDSEDEDQIDLNQEFNVS